MTHKCKGICSKYVDGTKKRYSNGQKFCKNCHVFIKWVGLWCPCCNQKLRTRPQAKKFRVPYLKSLVNQTVSKST